MRMKKSKIIGLGVMLTLVLFIISIPVAASLDPDSVELTLMPGDSATEEKDVCIPEVPAKADVLFSFDLTGSMGDILGTAKSNGIDIITGLDGTEVDIQYGVSSHMDYPDYYSSCGYSTTYGDASSGDYAYSLDQPITAVVLDVTNAINGLTLGYGADGPEDYTRVFYESYADPATGWRAGAKRVMVHFGDNVPHDCNLNAGIYPDDSIWTTGVDPGRDGIAGTADDLVLLTVLNDMAANNVMLIECHTSNWDEDYWTYWVGITDGDLKFTGSASLVADVIAAVVEGLTTPEVTNVHFEAESPYGDWIDSDWSYSGETDYCEDDIPLTITVPEGTTCGDYTFTVSAVDEAGVSYGDQEVTIHVPCVIPVSVDIKPGSCPNAFNRGEKGVLPVAILGSDMVDVSEIDPETVLLEGVAPIRWSIGDTGAPVPCDGECEPCECWQGYPDGFPDLNLKFASPAIAATSAVTGATVKGDPVPLAITGELLDGTPITGGDCLWIVK